MFKPLKLLGEVMALAYLVNENTDYCTMIRYSGHVNALNIRVFPSKKDCVNADCIYVSDFYVDGRYSDASSEVNLSELKTALEGYLLPNIDYEKEEAQCTI